MRRYIKQARDEGLDWQTALIMEMQTDIKQTIANGVLLGLTWAQLNTQISEIIKDTDELSDSLKERARQSLLIFATVLLRQMQTALNGVNLSILSQVQQYADKPSQKTADELKTQMRNQYIEIAQPLKEYSEEYMRKVKKAFDELADSVAKDDYSSNVSLRNVSEMTVRYEDKLKEVEKIKAAGTDLVYISAHANCSKRCQAAQGKLYSLSGKSGEIDGERYQPLSDVTEVYYTTKSGKTYRNGILYGFNCRHYLIPYTRGNKPVEVPAEVVKKYREINDTQRAMERDVRRLLDRAVTAPTTVERRAWKTKAKSAYERYKTYSAKNKVAYYPSRVELF